MRDRLAIRHAIERHRQVQRIGLHAKIGTRQRDPLGITGELEVGCRRLQGFEADVPIAENEHAPVLDAAMHAARHLQDFVRAEMHTREHVPPAIDHVGETRVVDDDGVEPRHVERALPRRRHREEEGLGHDALEKWPDHADRLAPMVVGGRDARIAQPHPFRRLFDRGTRRQENRDTALRA